MANQIRPACCLGCRTIRPVLAGVCFLFCVLGSPGGVAGQAQQPAPARISLDPVHLTSEQDHQRLMELLHITELRRGPDGDPKSPNAANVDETRPLFRREAFLQRS